MKRLDHYWYDENVVSRLLLPLSWLFCLLVMLRRAAYGLGLLRCVRVGVPVVVVGNISVGGSGKTPLVIWLAHYLRQHGRRVGIISRGYGGSASEWPQAVSANSDPAIVGDEPVVIARRTGCPMVVGPDRVAAARRLLATDRIDVILSDDGLQHYRLARQVEIAVIDGSRGLGNGHCLPAGPLREPKQRLDSVDLVVRNGGTGGQVMVLTGSELEQLATGTRRALHAFAGTRVHAVAGIGNPARFFSSLRAAGLDVVEHPFPDHYDFRPADVAFDDDAPVIMTEKDAVKCRPFADSRLWVLPVDAQVPDAVGLRVLELIAR